MEAQDNDELRSILLDEDFDTRCISNYAGKGGAWLAMKARYPLTAKQRLTYFECECGAVFKDFKPRHEEHEVYCDAKTRAAALAEAAVAKFNEFHGQRIDRELLSAAAMTTKWTQSTPAADVVVEAIAVFEIAKLLKNAMVWERCRINKHPEAAAAVTKLEMRWLSLAEVFVDRLGERSEDRLEFVGLGLDGTMKQHQAA